MHHKEADTPFSVKRANNNFVTSPLRKLSKTVKIPYKSMKFKNTVLSEAKNECPFMILNNTSKSYTKKKTVKKVTFVLNKPSIPKLIQKIN